MKPCLTLHRQPSSTTALFTEIRGKSSGLFDKLLALKNGWFLYLALGDLFAR